MKRISILGSTGSIGRNALRLVQMFPDRFSVKALAAGRNLKLLADQIKAFQPEVAAVFDEAHSRELEGLLPTVCRTQILHGENGYAKVAAWSTVDVTLSAIVGAAGLMPTLAAIGAGKTIALANKETLVMAGEIVTRLAAEKKVAILPVDSEHSAIFQCMQGQRREDVDRILLTASGGPFLDMPIEAFVNITPAQALQHPQWSMGAKISIDSATLMNKGLEVIEAVWLFGVAPEKIRVIVHPQSLIHSMVAFHDGAVIAQLGIPDMMVAIAYALSYPERLALEQPLPDLVGGAGMTFREPDLEKFPCLALALDAARTGGTLPAVLNAANEVAVQAFLESRVAFNAIPQIVGRTLSMHTVLSHPTLEAVIAADRWARQAAGEMLNRVAGVST